MEWVAAQKEELRSDVLKLILYGTLPKKDYFLFKVWINVTLTIVLCFIPPSVKTELNSTISNRSHRMEALKAVLEEFNHSNMAKHDQELDLNADQILFQKLCLGFTTDKSDEEVGMICCALEMCYRANKFRVGMSFHEISEFILPLFIDMLRHSSENKERSFGFNKVFFETEGDNIREVDDDSIPFEVCNVLPLNTVVEQESNDEDNSNEEGEYDNSDTNEKGMSHINLPNPPKRMDRDKYDDHINKENDVQRRERGVKNNENGKELDNDPTNHQTRNMNYQDEEKKDEGSKRSNFNSESTKLESSTTVDTGLSTTSDVTPQIKSASVGEENRNMSTKSLLENRTNSSKSMRQVRFSDTTVQKGSKLNSTVGRKESITHPLAVKKVLRILRYFSRVLSAMVPMARYPGLLNELIFQLHRKMISQKFAAYNKHNTHENDMKISVESDSLSFYSSKSNISHQTSSASNSGQENDVALENGIDAISTIVNLSCAEENKQLLLYHPGLLEAVIEVAKEDKHAEGREHAAIVLMNLALADSNKVSYHPIVLHWVY